LATVPTLRSGWEGCPPFEVGNGNIGVIPRLCRSGKSPKTETSFYSPSRERNMVYNTAELLATLGFNPQEKIISTDAFQRQLESYALHVVEDLPVSNKYSYYINENGKIFIDPYFQTELYIDPEERNGLAYEGITKAIEQALSDGNLGRVVVLYSPPGPVSFSSGTKYDKVKPYPSGQLYLMIGNSSNKVDCLAITVGQENERLILDIVLGSERDKDFNDVKTKITHYLTTPYLLSKNIDELIDYLLSYDPNIVVYKNVHMRPFTLGEVIEMIRLGWLGEIKPEVNLDGIFFPLIWNQDRNKAPFFYHQILDAYTGVYGNSYSLGGSCGGAIYSKGENSLFLRWSTDDINPLSTSWRVLSKLENSDRYEDYECPQCHQKIKGELKGQPDTWHTNCPHCGYEFRCKN